MKAKDPVCGMVVESETAAAHGSFGGIEVYFCSAACAEQYARAHRPT
jgi:YHS domain-containing protein